MGAVAVRRAQLHTEQEKIFTGVVDTWRVGINQQYLYSSGEYLIFAWLFQRKKVACRGILTAQDSSPPESRGGSSRLGNNTMDDGNPSLPGTRDELVRCMEEPRRPESWIYVGKHMLIE